MASVLILFFLVRLIMYLLKDKNEPTGGISQNRWRLRRQAKKGLTLSVHLNKISEHEYGYVPYFRFSVNGTIDVVHGERALTFTVRFYDITKGTAQEQPIYSTHYSIANERSEAVLVFKALTQAQFCVLTDFELGRVAPHLLHCPYHGESTILAKLTVVDTKYPEIVFATHSTTFTMTETSMGYVAIQETVKAQVRPVADLVATILARDESIEPDVMVQACAYLEELWSDMLPGHLVEALIDETMNVAMLDASRKTESRMVRLRQQIEAIEIALFPDVGELLCTVCLFCYGQLGGITDEAQRVVSMICDRFDVSKERMLELRDGFIRTHMYDLDVNPILAEMPDGLEREEQIQYLNDEYRRWRQRVTNIDPEVVREATHRLELIASLRSTLSSS